MGGNRIVIIIIVLLIAGTALIGAIPKSPNPPASNTPSQTIGSPTFGGSVNLPSLLRLINFETVPTVPPTPGVQPTATRTPTPTTGVPTPTRTNTPTQPAATPTTAGVTNTPTGIPPTPTVIAGACSWMDNGLPNVTEFYPNGSTAMPATTKEVCSSINTRYYSLPYRNPNCQATQAGIDRAYTRMQTYYPTYFPRTRLKQDWQTVQQYAIKYNFNPLFLISLWIEESGASGATQATKLGCDYRRNKNGTYTQMSPGSTICEQMECHFGLAAAYPGNYALWACQYRWGSEYWVSNQCTREINFTQGLDFWYNLIAQYTPGLPSSCRVQYSSGADSRCPAF